MNKIAPAVAAVALFAVAGSSAATATSAPTPIAPTCPPLMPSGTPPIAPAPPGVCVDVVIDVIAIEPAPVQPPDSACRQLGPLEAPDPRPC